MSQDENKLKGSSSSCVGFCFPALASTNWTRRLFSGAQVLLRIPQLCKVYFAFQLKFSSGSQWNRVLADRAREEVGCHVQVSWDLHPCLSRVRLSHQMPLIWCFSTLPLDVVSSLHQLSNSGMTRTFGITGHMDFFFFCTLPSRSINQECWELISRI